MNPMTALLNHIIDTAEKPGEAVAIVQFKVPQPPVQGALRRHQQVEGVYEILAIAQTSQNGRPIPIASFFTADAVSHVMQIQEDKLPRIVAPPQSGIIIPT